MFVSVPGAVHLVEDMGLGSGCLLNSSQKIRRTLKKTKRNPKTNISVQDESNLDWPKPSLLSSGFGGGGGGSAAVNSSRLEHQGA